MQLRHIVPWKRDNHANRSVEPIRSLHDQMGSLLESFFTGSPLAPFSGFGSAFGEDVGFGEKGALAPRIDVTETDEEIRVDAELPGVEEKDVELSYTDGVLVLRAEKSGEHEDESRGFHTRERFRGTFERSIPMPCPVEADQISASLEKGVLEVRCPKSAEARTKVHSIPVRKG